jgi:hypothetical protein
MCQHFVNGAIAGEVLEDVARGGAENDERGVAMSGIGQDLDGGVPVYDMGLNRNGTAAPGFIGNGS